jgi:hypothetical protein
MRGPWCPFSGGIFSCIKDFFGLLVFCFVVSPLLDERKRYGLGPDGKLKK